MIVCGIFLAVTGVLWIIGRKKLPAEKKKMFAIVALAAIFGLLAGVGDDADAVLTEEYLLERNEYGEGNYEQELILSVEGHEEKLGYKVTVPEQLLTTEQETEYLKEAVTEIQQEFPGVNESVNHIERSVMIRDTYQEGKVQATWSFENYDVVNLQGEVVAEELPREGVPVKARVELSCGDTERIEEFYFRVFPAARNEKEELLWQIEQVLKMQTKVQGQAYLELPEVIDGRRLEWHVEPNHTSEKVLLLGIVLAVFVPFLEQSRQQELKKQRAHLLELEYPEIVSKVALLLGAGMTVQGAVRKIAFAYEQKKQQLKERMPAYDELLTTCREIENGMGEGAAYERLGDRCESADYRKLGNMLAQNLKKGNCSIVTLLEQEAERAFEERKAVAKRYGEEAGTKLLFPMMLMLGLVIVVLVVPAVLAFQI